MPDKDIKLPFWIGIIEDEEYKIEPYWQFYHYFEAGFKPKNIITHHTQQIFGEEKDMDFFYPNNFGIQYRFQLIKPNDKDYDILKDKKRYQIVVYYPMAHPLGKKVDRRYRIFKYLYWHNPKDSTEQKIGYYQKLITSFKYG